MAAPLLARPFANGRAFDAKRPSNDATLLRKCCAVLRQGCDVFAWMREARPSRLEIGRCAARLSRTSAAACENQRAGRAWLRDIGRRLAPLHARRLAAVARGGLLGRSLLGAGWRRWRMKCAAAGRPMCAERRSLRTAVRRAAAVRKYRVAPPPADAAPGKLRRCRDG
ncbi:hypothetical protein F511_46910 [Dorcoceras hygrometricum]|uniref:Uncharacterized protein n=1 Tax=Dorcoceras hygrometricum TaxID=472368 RepID=A0A2Z6ZSE1_9LAMI|nr:hypothetical protein F511_46910 [Dorcoceras hygrometricum]